MDGVDWAQPGARGTLLVGEGSAKAVARVHAVQVDGGPCGHTSANEVWSMTGSATTAGRSASAPTPRASTRPTPTRSVPRR
eukprot:11166589-Lingulodinium_polyedra.AAC.1